MKKIGIMTMHRIINYGSYLQAYALKKIIETITDAKVEFIDYKFGEVLVDFVGKKSFFDKIHENRTISSYIKKKSFIRYNQKSYELYLQDLGVFERNYSHDIDLLVIGSDEVFNCMQGYPVGYSKNLFGESYEDIKTISYAGSFGHTTVEDLKKHMIFDEIKTMFYKFAFISVRDNNSKNVLSEMGFEVYKHLDPVLVYDFCRDVKNPAIDIKDYIIVYAYTGRLSVAERKSIKLFAKRHKKKIVSIGYYSDIADYNIVCNPLEVFGYFKNADYIITDTFHGTIFSIKMNSKFCTIIRDSNKNKINDLLRTLEQQDRIAYGMEDIERLYNIEVDFEQTNRIIQERKQQTIAYLKLAINS